MAASNPESTAAQRQFAAIAKVLTATPQVTLGSGKRGFGANALHIDAKLFAMVSSKGEFVVKLPKQRVDALEALGRGHRFDPGRGRLMKEWLAVTAGSVNEWTALAIEAMNFVRGRKNNELPHDA